MVTLVPLLLRASAVCGTATVGGVETDRNRSTDPSTASGLEEGLYAPPEKALRPAVVDAAIIRLDFKLQVVTDAVRGVGLCMLKLATRVFIAQSRVGANTCSADAETLLGPCAFCRVRLKEHEEDDHTGEREYSDAAQRLRGSRARGEELDSDGYGNAVRYRNQHEGELRNSHRRGICFFSVRPPSVDEAIVRFCDSCGQRREGDGGAQDNTHQFVVGQLPLSGTG
jgi:hypothetical protein